MIRRYQFEDQSVSDGLPEIEVANTNAFEMYRSLFDTVEELETDIRSWLRDRPTFLDDHETFWTIMNEEALRLKSYDCPVIPVEDLRR